MDWLTSEELENPYLVSLARGRDRQKGRSLLPNGEICVHESIESVMTASEPEPVAYLCTNPACYEKLELDHPAVLRKKRRDESVKEYRERLAALEKDAENDRALRAQADREWEEIVKCLN